MSPFPSPFVTSQIVDQQQNVLFGVFDHPEGWQVTSQINWMPENNAQPATVYILTLDPESGEGFEFLPMAGCCWVEPMFGFNQAGQQSYGLTVMPPMSAGDALIKMVVTDMRGNRQNLRVLGVRPVPNLAQSVNADEVSGIPSEGVMARVQYEENGRHWEEDFYACRYQLPPNGGQLNWGLARVFCFRSQAGTLDSKGQMFWRIACSLRKNPQWMQLYTHIAQSGNMRHRQFTQNQMDRLRQEQIDQQRYLQYNDWSRNLHQQIVNERWASGERRQEGVGEMIGGYTGYQDPQSRYGNIHQDYTNSRYVWTDGQGGWQYSDDPNFNPNIGSDRSWYLAPRR